MKIEGLIAPGAEDVQTIEKLSYMMGESFMEENWTRATLDALGKTVSDERKLELSREIMRLEFTYGTPYPACYATPDLAAEPTVTVLWSESGGVQDGQTMRLSEAGKLGCRRGRGARPNGTRLHDARRSLCVLRGLQAP